MQALGTIQAPVFLFRLSPPLLISVERTQDVFEGLGRGPGLCVAMEAMQFLSSKKTRTVIVLSSEETRDCCG